MKLKHYICECLVIPTLAVKANVIVTLTTLGFACAYAANTMNIN